LYFQELMMKSKLTKFVIAAVLSLAWAAPSSAQIGTGDNATLFLQVYDTAGANTIYIRDLGVSLLNFGTQNRTINTANSPAFTNIVDDQFNDCFVSSTDANWSAFLAGASGAANVKWDVVAVDAVASAGPDGIRAVYTSLTDAVADIAPVGAQAANSGLNSLQGVIGCCRCRRAFSVNLSGRACPSASW
jgi:hypothetical protein